MDEDTFDCGPILYGGSIGCSWLVSRTNFMMGPVLKQCVADDETMKDAESGKSFTVIAKIVQIAKTLKTEQQQKRTKTISRHCCRDCTLPSSLLRRGALVDVRWLP